MKRVETLMSASDLICGQRQEDYGTPQQNFGNIAKLWSVVLDKKIEPWQVALCMAQVKAARLISSPTNTDSWVDMAGYVGLGSELAE